MDVFKRLNGGFPAGINHNFFLYRWTLLHAIRMTVASTLAFATAYALNLPEALSAVITAIVVTQSNVGGSLRTAIEQIFGSLLGAVYGIAIALVIQPADPFSSAAALAIALLPLSILASRSPGFRIAPVTAVIVLLGISGLEMDPLNLGANRILGVGLGSIVGLFVSLLLVPARASRSVFDSTGRIIGLLSDQLRILASGGAACQEAIASKAMETRENLVRLASHVEEVAHERRARLADVPDGERILRTLRRLRHDIDMLRRTAREGGNDSLHECALSFWHKAADSGASALHAISRIFAGEEASYDSAALADSIRDYRSALEDARRADFTPALSTEELGRLFGIGFALDQLRLDLEDLANVAGETRVFQKKALE